MNLAPFVGKPFAPFAHGPDAYDCWGLTFTAARDLFGLQFPRAVYASVQPDDVAFSARAMLVRRAWQERDAAAAGHVLALASYDGCVRHVGLCLDNARVLHVTRLLRSCVMPVHKLTALYPVARFYAWAP